MTETVIIDGLRVNLAPPPENTIVADVVVLRRFVDPDDNSDFIRVAPSEITSGVTATGMITIAQAADLKIWGR